MSLPFDLAPFLAVFRTAGLAAILFCGACGLSAPGSEAGRRGPPAAATPPLAERLTVQVACDETLAARDQAATVALAVDLPGILARARGAALPYRETVEVGDDLAIRLERGADLEHWCTDVMERPPRIDAVWLGVSGEAVVTLVARTAPDSPRDERPHPQPTEAVVDLRGIVLAREGRPEESTTLSGLRLTGTLGVPGGG